MDNVEYNKKPPSGCLMNPEYTQEKINISLSMEIYQLCISSSVASFTSSSSISQYDGKLLGCSVLALAIYNQDKQKSISVT